MRIDLKVSPPKAKKDLRAKTNNLLSLKCQTIRSNGPRHLTKKAKTQKPPNPGRTKSRKKLKKEALMVMTKMKSRARRRDNSEKLKKSKMQMSSKLATSSLEKSSIMNSTTKMRISMTQRLDLAVDLMT